MTEIVKKENGSWKRVMTLLATFKPLALFKNLTRLLLCLVAICLSVISTFQLIELWPKESNMPNTRESTRVLMIKPGGEQTFIDPRQARTSEPRRHIEIHTHFERIDFENENVTFRLTANVDRDWLDLASRDFPDALLLFRLFKIVPESVEARRTAQDLLRGTDDEDFVLSWDIGTFTQSFEADASSYPLDKVFQYGQYDMIWMKSERQGFPKDEAPVYLDWTYSVANRNVGWVLKVNSTPHPRNAFGQRAEFSFQRDSNTVTHIVIYLASLFCISVAVAYFSIYNAGREGQHFEDIGGIAALALAIPAIRTLLPNPEVSISTLLDASFLLIFSIVISALLVRIAVQIK